MYLGQTHRDGRLPGPGFSGEKDRPPRDLTLLNHLVDNAGCPPSSVLPNQPLANVARLEGVVQPQAADVAVRADALDARKISHFCVVVPERDVCSLE